MKKILLLCLLSITSSLGARGLFHVIYSSDLEKVESLLQEQKFSHQELKKAIDIAEEIVIFRRERVNDWWGDAVPNGKPYLEFAVLSSLLTVISPYIVAFSRNNSSMCMGGVASYYIGSIGFGAFMGAEALQRSHYRERLYYTALKIKHLLYDYQERV